MSLPPRSYADDYPANIYEYVWNEWFRVMQPITSRVPYMVCPGTLHTSCRLPLSLE
jgi:hypothetical protein